MARSRKALSAALVLLLTLGVGAGLLWARKRSSDGEPAPAKPSVHSVEVTRTSLSDTRELDGTLGFGAVRTIQGGGEGIVTWLPAAGRTIKRSGSLFRVDDRPSVVFYGDTPLYRPLDTVGLVGRDVRVVAENLTALGYDIGVQPGPGTSITQQVPPAENAAVRADPAQDVSGTKASAKQPSQQPHPSAPPPLKVQSGDGLLTAELVAAIKRWQPTAGFDPTGVLEARDVVVTSGPVRVQSLAGRVAGPASEDLLKVTGTTRRVTVVVDSQDLSSIRQKQRVTVIMPDQSSVPGTVTAISSIVPDDQDDPEGNGAPSQLRVTVKIGQKRLPRGVDTVKVQVKFIAKARPKVLAVPVGALLALREGGYGVQVSGGELVPVETGLFAMGLVEISGPGIAEGTLVETTA